MNTTTHAEANVTTTNMRRRTARTTVAAVMALTMLGGVVAADEHDAPTESLEVAPAGDDETTEEQPEWKRIKSDSKLGFHELHVAIMEAFHLAKQGWIAECAEGGDPSSEDCKVLHEQIKQDKKNAKVDLREMRAKARAEWKAAKEEHKLAKMAERDPEKAAAKEARNDAKALKKADRAAAKASKAKKDK